MAAVRGAATKLGGSLLQRTQAAVADEGRRLVPSRFMRSHQLSGEHPRAHFTRQIQQKKKELYDAVSKAEQKKQELFDLLCQEEKACLANEQHLSAQATKGPVDPLPGKVYSKRARGVLDLTCKVTFLVYASAFLLGITGTGKMLGLTREAHAHSARQTQQKEQDLYDLLSKANERHLSGQATEKRPFDPRRWNVYSERARAVLDVVCKVTFFVYGGAFLLGITGAGKMLGITKEVSEDKIKK